VVRVSSVACGCARCGRRGPGSLGVQYSAPSVVPLCAVLRVVLRLVSVEVVNKVVCAGGCAVLVLGAIACRGHCGRATPVCSGDAGANTTEDQAATATGLESGVDDAGSQSARTYGWPRPRLRGIRWPSLGEARATAARRRFGGSLSDRPPAEVDDQLRAIRTGRVFFISGSLVRWLEPRLRPGVTFTRVTEVLGSDYYREEATDPSGARAQCESGAIGLIFEVSSGAAADTGDAEARLVLAEFRAGTADDDNGPFP
jgi:hypothetical protein